MEQLSLLKAVVDEYVSADGGLNNTTLYDRVSTKLDIDDSLYVHPVGKAQTRRNLFHRRIRWCQQSLKQSKYLKQITRGTWELTNYAKTELHSIKAGQRIIAMSTELGICIWSQSDAVFRDIIDEPIHLVLTSPPYPLKISRAYGNVCQSEYVDFICRSLEPVIAKLATGASIVLNLSNDIFEDRSPARSTYLERLVVALEDRFGLSKMDLIPWVSNKPPGPVAWASKKRYQLNTGYEPILWFCNDPHRCYADNRRVLKSHTKSHQRFVENGGIKSEAKHGDGVYRKRAGAYSKVTDGRIPRNVLEYSNYCESGRAVNQYARQLGIPPHAAKMPLSLANFLIQYLSRPGDLVADLFAGTLTTAQASEQNNRRWVCSEKVWEYIRQSFIRFGNDAWFNPAFVNAGFK